MTRANPRLDNNLYAKIYQRTLPYFSRDLLNVDQLVESAALHGRPTPWLPWLLGARGSVWYHVISPAAIPKVAHYLPFRTQVDRDWEKVGQFCKHLGVLETDFDQVPSHITSPHLTSPHHALLPRSLPHTQSFPCQLALSPRQLN